MNQPKSPSLRWVAVHISGAEIFSTETEQMPQRINLIGQTFGRLLVTGEHGRDKFQKKLWICMCKDGNIVYANTNVLRKGAIKSCGCLSRDHILKINQERRRYSIEKARAKQVWRSMLSRCIDKRNVSYENYGAKGIGVAESWMDFEQFYEDMGDSPRGMMLDRIENTIGYCKENCRLVARKTQNRNKRFHIYLELYGERRLLVEWAEMLNVKYDSLYNRKVNLEWSDEETLTIPMWGQACKSVMCTLNIMASGSS